MHTYNSGFARVYNARWGGFASHVAPFIREFYAASPGGEANPSVLDLCCGAGHLAAHFLVHGYRVVGLDLSEDMLHYARENCAPYLASGQARFVQGDASDFTLEERFGLVVSTYDALNHLTDQAALQNCFRCVHAVCEGLFIFDLNTRKGLRQWNNVHVDDDNDEVLIITRGFYDDATGKAWTRISGFTRAEGPLYERFELTAFNTAFDLERVYTALLDTGWQHVYFAKIKDLQSPLAEPEAESRVFVVAGK